MKYIKKIKFYGVKVYIVNVPGLKPQQPILNKGQAITTRNMCVTTVLLSNKLSNKKTEFSKHIITQAYKELKRSIYIHLS